MEPTEPIIIRRSLTREQVRAVDRRAIDDFGMSGLVLMENAGRGVAEFLVGCATPGRVAILCGKGNNAGDGYVIARHLQLAGWPVRIVQLNDPGQLRGDALANWNIAQKAGIPTVPYRAEQPRELEEALGECDVVVDCMLGTGASGDPREPLATAIRIANSRDVLRIAVDTPSGLDCQTGYLGEPHFIAHHTCTMVAPKVGFERPEARPVVGRVHVVGIGVPRVLLESLTQEDDRSRS